MASKWNYSGDMNLEHGGFFWKLDNPTDDYVDVVEIIPDSDVGGADNVFRIFVGAIYTGRTDEDKKKALDCLGWMGTVDEAPMCLLVDALQAYWGIDVSEDHSIRIGEIDPFTAPATMGEINILQIRGNWKLKNYVKKEFLGGQ